MTNVPRPRFDRVINPHHQDWAVVFGPNVRWVEDDTWDLLKDHPEVLLGYRVKMSTPDTMMQGALQGVLISKLVILEAPMEMWPRWFRGNALQGMMPGLMTTDFSKLEYWYVHRGDPIRQVGKTQNIGRRW